MTHHPFKAPYCYPVYIGFDACPHGVSGVAVYDGQGADKKLRFHTGSCLWCEVEKGAAGQRPDSLAHPAPRIKGE